MGDHLDIWVHLCDSGCCGFRLRNTDIADAVQYLALQVAEIDDIVIEGTHRVHASLTPAAVSIQGAGLMIMNAVHDVIAAPPGLRSVLDFSMGGRRRGGFRLVLDPARPPAPGTTWVVRQPLP